MNNYENYKIIREDSYKFRLQSIENEKIDIIFLDPPYKDTKINEILDRIKSSSILKDNSLVILHRNIKTKEKLTTNFTIIKEKKYGLSRVMFGKILP